MRINWTDQIIKEELEKSIKILMLDRMPCANELKSIGRNDLHCKISRTKKYSGWAQELGLNLKNSETTTGQKWEKFIGSSLNDYGYDVELMTTKHPYDLLINGTVKVDVKVANPYLLKGSRVHTFALNKSNPTCDVYILVALDEEGNRERTLFIPSHHVKKTMVNMGKNSKYNRYDGNWSLISLYSDFYNTII